MKSCDLARPQTIAVAPNADARDIGFVESNIAAGELFVRSAKNQSYRLVWKTEDKDRLRAMSPGRYRVIGYRILRTDKEGQEWFISVASHGYRGLTVRAGGKSRLEVDDRIFVRCRAWRDGRKIEVQMSIEGDRKSGLSIYRNGKRISIRYQALDRDGTEIVSGNMRYG